MALSARDVLKLAVSADTSKATREFDKLGRSIKGGLGDAEKQATGLSGKFGGAFDKLAQKSTLVSGGLQKLGLSSQQAGAALATALPAAGLAAAAGLGIFAAKSVSAFQETALAADKFRDSTGLSIEESSKWIAVADDVGISADTFRNAFSKMEKAIATNRAAFGDLVATAKDGGVDLSATFLNAITHLQGIEDPIQRANEAAKLFGRGWQEISQIVTTDADTLKTALEGVSEAQIIDEEEVGKARKYQAAMDDLKDAVFELQLQFGEGLVPAVAEAAQGLAAFINIANTFSGPVGGISGAMDKLINNAPLFGNAMNFSRIFQDNASGVDRFGGAVGTFIPVLGNWISGLDNGKQKAAALTDEMGRMSRGFASAHGGAAGYSVAMQAVNNANNQVADSVSMASAGVRTYGQTVRDANNALLAFVNAQLASVDAGFAVADSYRSFQAANQAATAAVDDGTTAVNEQEAAFDAAAQAAIANASATVAYAQKQAEAEGATLSAKASQQILIGTLRQLAGQASGPTAAAIQAVITKLQTVGAQKPNPTINANDQATGKINSVQASLNALNGRTATVALNAIFNGGAAMSEANRFLSIARQAQQAAATLPRGASGFTNFPGGLAMVGEEGPELVILPTGADVVPAQKTQAMMSAPRLLPTGGGGGVGTVVNFNGTFLTSKAELGRMVDEAIAESRRRGARAA